MASPFLLLGVAVLGGWYRKVATLTATKKWGAGAPLVSSQGLQGLGRGQFWGNSRLMKVFCCAVFWLRLFFGFAVFAVGGAVLGEWYRKVAALTAMVRKDRKGWAGGSFGGMVG